MALGDFMFNSVAFFQPFLIQSLTGFFADVDAGVDRDVTDGFLYALGLTAVAFVSASMLMTEFAIGGIAAARIRSTIMCAIFDKAIRVAPWALRDVSSGTQLSMLSQDCQRLYTALMWSNELWGSPFVLIVSMNLMYRELGVSALATLGFMLLLIPLQIVAGKAIGYARAMAAQKTDHRVKLVGELLQGVRLVKLQAWEQPMAEALSQARADELVYIRLANGLTALSEVMVFVWPAVVTFGTVLVYTALEDDMSEAKVFTILAYVRVYPNNAPYCLLSYITSLSHLIHPYPLSSTSSGSPSASCPPSSTR
jgi:ATP-binding cassette subfamily C (CFTR/MRP) protein 4